MKAQTLTFKNQFAEPVKAGLKTSTIRPNSDYRRKLKIGSGLHLRQWSGTPYNSPQIHLGEGEVIKTKQWY